MAKKAQMQKSSIPEQVVENKKELSKKREFPNISRFIPDRPSFGMPKIEKLTLKWGIVVVLAIIGLVLNLIVLQHLFITGKSWIALEEKRQQLSQEMSLWENITKEYPNYRDAYFEGALFAYRLGDSQKKQDFLNKLQLIDPNFPLTQGLEKLQNVE